jgi:hypothetical protein
MAWRRRRHHDVPLPGLIVMRRVAPYLWKAEMAAAVAAVEAVDVVLSLQKAYQTVVRPVTAKYRCGPR